MSAYITGLLRTADRLYPSERPGYIEPKEEEALGEAILHGNDGARKRAGDELILRSVRIVWHLAIKVSRHTSFLGAEDLFGAGMVALSSNGLNTYNYTKRPWRYHAPLTTSSAMWQYVDDCGYMVRIPSEYNRILRKAEKFREKTIAETGIAPTLDEIASHFGIMTSTLLAALRARRINGTFMPMHAVVDVEGSYSDNADRLKIDTGFLPEIESPEDYIQRREYEEMSCTLAPLLAELTDTERDVINGLYGLSGEPLPLKDVAAGVGVWPKTVRRIEKRAIAKLREMSKVC